MSDVASCIRCALAQLDEADETLENYVPNPPSLGLTAVDHARMKIAFAIQDLQSALKGCQTESLGDTSGTYR